VLRVQLLERAELEVRDAYTWHEAQQPGLGDRFLEMVDHYLALPTPYGGRQTNDLPYPRPAG
jgi:hypothetical protein